MESKFKELNSNRKEKYGKVYIGASLGSFRSYPTAKQVTNDTAECVDYDPRFRPWYV